MRPTIRGVPALFPTTLPALITIAMWPMRSQGCGGRSWESGPRSTPTTCSTEPSASASDPVGTDRSPFGAVRVAPVPSSFPAARVLVPVLLAAAWAGSLVWTWRTGTVLGAEAQYRCAVWCAGEARPAIGVLYDDGCACGLWADPEPDYPGCRAPEPGPVASTVVGPDDWAWPPAR